MTKDECIIAEKLDKHQLIQQLRDITKTYAGKYYEHQNGGLYQTGAATTINIDGVSYWGITYFVVDRENDEVWYEIMHTRPLHEFLDGRFKEITKKRGDCK